MTPTRQLRADATRNRESVLAAAEAEFAERGPSASIADIANRAGVAKGTVFRHFATKEDLMAAIVVGHISTLAAAALRLTNSPDPESALLEFLTLAADQRQRHDLTFLQSASEGHPGVGGVRTELMERLSALVGRAREAGAIRSDITEADVYLLMCAPIHAVESLSDPPPDLWRRYLAIIFDGLRPAGASELTHPAPRIP